MNIRTLLILLVGFGLGLSVASWRADDTSNDSIKSLSLPSAWEGSKLMGEVIETIEAEYVETIPNDQLVESALDGMISELDPHSDFLDSEEYREVRIATSGNYAGIGVELNTDEKAIQIVAPLMGSPADRAGILAGDVIVAVNNVRVDTDDIPASLARLRGKAGTSVDVAVSRKKHTENIEFALVRERIDLHTVNARLVEPGLAYLRISQFSDTTSKDLIAAYVQLEDQEQTKITGVILDLRDNPGGVLDAAVSVSDAFLEKGVIVTAEGRSQASDFSFSAHPGDISGGASLIVLVNGNSASASEIVAGALQDHRRAILMGDVTFGKGSVQTVLPLSDGQAVKLTTSKYYTPSGQSIHGSGITPDIIIDAEQDNLDDAQLGQAVHYLKSSRLFTQNQ